MRQRRLPVAWTFLSPPRRRPGWPGSAQVSRPAVGSSRVRTGRSPRIPSVRSLRISELCSTRSKRASRDTCRLPAHPEHLSTPLPVWVSTANQRAVFCVKLRAEPCQPSSGLGRRRANRSATMTGWRSSSPAFDTSPLEQVFPSRIDARRGAGVSPPPGHRNPIRACCVAVERSDHRPRPDAERLSPGNSRIPIQHERLLQHPADDHRRRDLTPSTAARGSQRPGARCYRYVLNRDQPSPRPCVRRRCLLSTAARSHVPVGQPSRAPESWSSTRAAAFARQRFVDGRDLHWRAPALRRAIPRPSPLTAQRFPCPTLAAGGPGQTV